MKQCILIIGVLLGSTRAVIDDAGELLQKTISWY